MGALGFFAIETRACSVGSSKVGATVTKLKLLGRVSGAEVFENRNSKLPEA